jgi:hypothetical protein
MNCRESRSGWIETARGLAIGEASRAALLEHLEVCAECAGVLEAQRALTAAMEELSTAAIPPADWFAAPVMAEFDRVHAPRRSMPAFRWLLAAGLAAAACLAVIMLHRQPPVMRPVASMPPVTASLAPPPQLSIPAKPARRVKTVTSRPVTPETEQPFFPIPYTAPLGPGEWARVERMQIPVAALIAAGFHMPVLDPAAIVEADVLVSQDGRIRAIRPLSISNSN